MTKKIAIILSYLAVALASASPSAARTKGTKWRTNLVPESSMDPTIFERSKVSFKDKGQLKASIQGLTDGVGGVLIH